MSAASRTPTPLGHRWAESFGVPYDPEGQARHGYFVPFNGVSLETLAAQWQQALSDAVDRTELSALRSLDVDSVAQGILERIKPSCPRLPVLEHDRLDTGALKLLEPREIDLYERGFPSRG